MYTTIAINTIMCVCVRVNNAYNKFTLHFDLIRALFSIKKFIEFINVHAKLLLLPPKIIRFCLINKSILQIVSIIIDINPILFLKQLQQQKKCKYKMDEQQFWL